MSSELFQSLELRNLKIKNRIFVSPMCMYSAQDGVANSWHMVHIGSRAVGGAGLIIMEATGVTREGRITPGCLGLWGPQHVAALKPIVEFCKTQNTAIGIQLAHAGRKASSHLPWEDGGKPLSTSEGAWQTVAPSAVPFSEKHPIPHELTQNEIEKIVQAFGSSAKLAMQAGYNAVELHMAHGYLMHEFLSPLSNKRSDMFGGSLENRMRMPLQVAEAVRKTLPDEVPLLARISATDWVEGGWDLQQSIAFAKELKKIGVDLIDCSTGGNVSHVKIPTGPGYQVPFAAGVRKEAGIKTGAVGQITDAQSACEIIKSGQADAVLLARELLRDPYWPLHAAKKLGVDVPWPPQYERAK